MLALKIQRIGESKCLLWFCFSFQMKKLKIIYRWQYDYLYNSCIPENIDMARTVTYNFKSDRTLDFAATRQRHFQTNFQVQHFWPSYLQDSQIKVERKITFLIQNRLWNWLPIYA